MTVHSFDTGIASKVGLNAAVIYQNILFWTQKNMANGRHIHDGSVWTYNSIKAWSELFPYLSADKIRRALAKLVEAEMIVEGNYNKSAYDRTKWYGVKTQFHLAKTTNGIGENPEPIPDSNTDNKPDGNTDMSTNVAGASDIAPILKPDLFVEFWERYPRKVAKPNARRAYEKAAKKFGHDAIMFGLSQHLPAMEASERQFIPHAATWLNGERFNDEPEQQSINASQHTGIGSGTAKAAAAVAQRRINGQGSGFGSDW